MVVHPTIRRMIPSANKIKGMARLAFSAMLITSLSGIPYTIYTGFVKRSSKSLPFLASKPNTQPLHEAVQRMGVYSYEMGVRAECNYNFGGGTTGGRLGLARLNEELLKEDMPPNDKLHNPQLSRPGVSL